MNNTTTACGFDCSDFGQGHVSFAERTRVAATVEFPRFVTWGVEQKKQVFSPRNPTECRAATVVPFVHAYGSSHLAAQNPIDTQCVHVGRNALGIVLVVQLAGL